MDYSDIIEVQESTDMEYINERLADGWVLLGVAPGQDEGCMAYIKYSIGRRCPEDEPPTRYI